MSHPLIKRLFHSIFTKLLVIILAAGLAITVTLVVGFAVIRFHSIGHLDRNLLMYGDYLLQDLGDPPELRRAEQIARRTGMAIAFEHPQSGWQTAAFPTALPLDRAHVRRHESGIRTGHLRGYTFIRMEHAGGHLVFIASRWAGQHETAWQVFLAMAAVLFAILAAAYLSIRRVLKPINDLKIGAEQLGAGRLAHRVPLAGHDEFAGLSRAFNEMAGRLSALLNGKEQLLLDVSHELRSPLTRLKVQVELIRDEAIRQNLKADVEEMEAMVTAILEQARLRNAAGALRLEATDMAGLIKRVTGEFDRRLPGVAAGTLEAANARVDREKMRMVLRNLIDNALKNSPENGEPVLVSMKKTESGCEITVTDKGVGIAESALPHLFEPFYRTDASRSRRTGGYGLGLSLCKAVVDAHNGKIVLAGAPGRGTRVTVTIPG